MKDNNPFSLPHFFLVFWQLFGELDFLFSSSCGTKFALVRKTYFLHIKIGSPVLSSWPSGDSSVLGSGCGWKVSEGFADQSTGNCPSKYMEVPQE